MCLPALGVVQHHREHLSLRGSAERPRTAPVPGPTATGRPRPGHTPRPSAHSVERLATVFHRDLIVLHYPATVNPLSPGLLSRRGLHSGYCRTRYSAAARSRSFCETIPRRTRDPVTESNVGGNPVRETESNVVPYWVPECEKQSMRASNG